MEQFDILKSTADLMLGDMIKGQPDLKELSFNIDFFGKGYRVYYQRETIGDKQIWKLISYERIDI